MSKYWENRKADMMWQQMEVAEDTAKKAISSYEESYNYIDSKAKKLYNKVVYSNISNADKKRLLSKLKGDSYNEILQTAKSLGLNDIVELLESPGYKSKFSQYENLKKEIDAEIKKIRNNELGISESGYKKIAYDGYYKSIYEIQKQTGLGFSFNQFDEKLYNKIINSKWSGSNYSTRIWNNTNKLAQDLKSELLQGLITGKTQKEMSKTILKKYQQSAYNTRRLIRTESCFVSNEIERQAYLECDIEKCRFVATLDLRTSQECQERDGNIIDVRKATVGIDIPPLHPFCRSTTIAIVDDEAYSKMERRARNPVTGKLEKVPANMTYKEWKKKYVKKGLAAGDITTIDIPEHKPPEFIEKIDITDNEILKSKLEEYENIIRKEPIENAIVITKEGEVYRCYGTLNGVDPETDLGDKIKGGIVTHNHPLGSANEYSFSNADINLFMDNELKILRGVDDMFNYEFSISDKSIDDAIPILEVTEYDVRHCQVIKRAQQLNIGYRRERI